MCDYKPRQHKRHFSGHKTYAQYEFNKGKTQKKQVRALDRMIRGSKKSVSRKERYCTTGQGASGPEGGRAAESEEETSVFSDRPSSQLCQEESTVLRRKLRGESDTQCLEWNRKFTRIQNVLEEAGSSAGQMCSVTLCGSDIPQDMAGPDQGGLVHPSDLLDLSSLEILCHPDNFRKCIDQSIYERQLQPSS